MSEITAMRMSPGLECRQRYRSTDALPRMPKDAAARPHSASRRLDEPQRDRVNAIPQPCRVRTVIEQIAEVCITPTTRHPAVGIPVTRRTVMHVLLRNRLPEARPPRARVELVRRTEQRCV